MGNPSRRCSSLGASGDLAARLLVPGLAHLLGSGRDGSLQLVGAGAQDWDQDRWREVVTTAFSSVVDVEGSAVDAARRVRDASRYHQVDVTILTPSRSC